MRKVTGAHKAVEHGTPAPTVVAVNAALGGTPELVNSDPHGEGWMIRLRTDDPAAADRLLDAAAYRALISA